MRKFFFEILAFIIMFLFIAAFLFSKQLPPLPEYRINGDKEQDTEEVNLDSLSLQQLLNLEVKLAPRNDQWRITVLLTLRIFGENLKFTNNKKEIRIATDIEQFHTKLWTGGFHLHSLPIKDFIFYPGEPVDYDMDIVFLQSNKLAKKFASKGNTLIFSNKKSCRNAAFVITLKGNKLKVHIREKNIKNQGAAFTKEFLNSLRKRK